MPSMLSNAMEQVFGTPKAPPVAAPAVTPPVVPPVNTVPEPKPTAPTSLLDKHKQVWETPPAPKVDPNAPKPFLDNISEEAVSKAAKTVAFTNAVTPEIREKIAKGGAEAQEAFMEALNTVAQEVYGKTALAGSAITKKALEEMRGDFLKELPKLIREHTTKGSASRLNPVFKDPALAPVVSALEQTFTVKFPEASADEIATMVQTYMDDMTTHLQNSKAKPKTRSNKNGTDDVDWEAFANADKDS